jgi:hypothetical protein
VFAVRVTYTAHCNLSYFTALKLGDLRKS